MALPASRKLILSLIAMGTDGCRSGEMMPSGWRSRLRVRVKDKQLRQWYGMLDMLIAPKKAR